jgi:hypothetical protein
MSLARAYYELKFESEYLRSRGNTFQELFAMLMGKAYKTDFMACRPWGRTGDQKNDGFLKSEQQLFQVYAPDEMDAKTAIKKISEDFSGALQHWGKLFNKWAFVHNANNGLPPHVQRFILEFEQAHPGIKIEVWGLEKLKEVFRKLSLDDLTSWFGSAPREETRIGFADLQHILKFVATKDIPVDIPVKEVPPDKIKANDLSESVSILLKAGMQKTIIVDDFFKRWADETLGGRVATAFREKYRQLRKEVFIPNAIFAEMQQWAGGSGSATPEHQLAVLAVLAYYFERCDIFEEPGAVRT